MSTNRTVPGWHIRPDHTSPFVRTFTASPETPVAVEYKAAERRHGKLIDATYPARIAWVNIRWQWDVEQGKWWGQCSQAIELLNHRTGEPYQSGWRAGTIREHGAFLEKLPDHFQLLEDATNPRTTITVTEVPA